MGSRFGRWLVVLMLALAGCTPLAASGPPFGQAAASLPPLKPGMTRIFFYRALRPYDIVAPTTVYLNDQPVGVSWMGTAFYRDVTPGPYHITVFSPGFYPDQFKTVSVAAGQELFVRIDSLLTYSRLICSGECQLNTFVVQVLNPAVAAREMQALPLVPG